MTVLLIIELLVIAAAITAVPRMRRAGEAEWRRHQRGRAFVRIRVSFEQMNAALVRAQIDARRMSDALRPIGRVHVNLRDELRQRQDPPL